MADGIMGTRGIKDSGQNFRCGFAAQPAEVCCTATHYGLFFACCLLLSMVCYAEELRDPTQPPDSLLVSVEVAASGVVAVRPAGLQSIIISKARRAAIIDGETIELGGHYGDAKLIEVNAGSVTLEGAQGRKVMTLFPNVIMTGKQGIKMRPLPPMGEVRSGRQKNKPDAREERR